MGDKQGHPFRGNQHAAAQGAATDRRIGITPGERAKADLYDRKSAELRRLSEREHDLRRIGRDVPPELSARVEVVATELAAKRTSAWTPAGGGKSVAELSGEVRRIAENARRPGESADDFVQRQLAHGRGSEGRAEEAAMGARLRAGMQVEEATSAARREANVDALNLRNPHEHGGVPKPVFDKSGRVTNLGEMERAARAQGGGPTERPGDTLTPKGKPAGDENTRRRELTTALRERLSQPSLGPGGTTWKVSQDAEQRASIAASRRKDEQRVRRNEMARARRDAYRSLGMKKGKYGGYE